MPEAKKPMHRRGICEEESSHGVIMEKFIKDVSRNTRAGRGVESNDQSQRSPRKAENIWKGASFTKRGSVIQERGYEGSAFGGGGFHLNSTLVSRRRVLERKRRYQCDIEGQGSTHDEKGYARKRPFECSEMRKAVSLGSLNPLPFTKSQPVDFVAMPYVCDECGKCFGVISEFVEHQIMHTRENLYEYGESFIHSVSVSEVQKRQGGGKHFECKECGEVFSKSAALAEHRKIHAREYLAECKDEEDEEPFMPSPTFSELQKIYGKDKFYECKVCKETFLHSSALIEHQKVHGRENFSDDKNKEHRETLKPSSSLHALQKMYGREKLYECKVCAETFHHSASLREHQKIHTRGKSFENKGKVYEETFIPGQKRHQSSYSKEMLYDFKNSRKAFMPNSNLSGHLKILARKSLCEGRGYSKSVTHLLPFNDSQKSHTITRPPENEEEEKAFTISSNPDASQKLPTEGKVYERKPHERSVIHSLAFAEAQKSHCVRGSGRSKAVTESTIQSTDVSEHQKVCAQENSSETKTSERLVIHGLDTFKRPKSLNANELVECHEEGESTICVSDINDKKKKTIRENPNKGSKSNNDNNYQDSFTHSISQAQSQENVAGEGSSEFKAGRELPLSNSNVCEHQKARAKKKNIESKNHETSVIQSLCFSELGAILPREKFCECQLCGESFTQSSDLTEHQKIHSERKPPGNKNYEQSVIRSLASNDPQASYTEPQAQTRCTEEPGQSGCAEAQAQTWCEEEKVHTGRAGQSVRSECRKCGECVAATRDRGVHQKISDQEKVHRKKLSGDSVIQGAFCDRPQQEGSQQKQPRQEESSEDEEKAGAEDSIYGCKDCGLGFADPADLKEHQKVHRYHLIDTCEYKQSIIHTGSISDYQRDYVGERLYECQTCGESFVHSSFLLEHQRVHEQDQLSEQRICDESFMQPLNINPRRPLGPQKSPPVGMFLQCRVCGQDFIHFSVLSEHMRTHEGENFLEQGGRGEAAFVSDLALTAFQRNQAEERKHGCEACGKVFFSQSDLKEHFKIHETDEPYDYGASFVHTSFLTEPPKRESPSYECKDCGESLTHNTALTKYQKLHERKQEVQIDVLVPREVLWVQGSNVEAAEQEVEAAQPEVEAAEPDVEATEPSMEAAEPSEEAQGPGGEAAVPNRAAEQPIGDADEPDGAGIEDPEESAEKPEGDADEPDGAGIEDPEEEGENKELEVEEADCDSRECRETFQSSPAHLEHLAVRARAMSEAAGAYGESACYVAGASTRCHAGADYTCFKCDVCGQRFRDPLALVKHQDIHVG